MGQYQLETLEPAKVPETEAFLRKSLAANLLLMGNLRDFGPRLGNALNSGNFKTIRNSKSDQIVQVLVLTRRGNLLTSPGPLDPEILPIWNEAVRAELPEIQIRGCLGDWNTARAIWTLLSREGLVQRHPKLISQELLFELYPLPESAPFGASQFTISRLSPADFEEWKPLRLAFWREEGVPNDLSESQLQESFERGTSLGRAFGLRLKESETLISTALLTSVVDFGGSRAGQIGGVYTLPDHRERGHAKRLMNFLIEDARAKHRLDRLTLFTARGNSAAQTLYGRLGFRECGEYGIFLEEPKG